MSVLLHPKLGLNPHMTYCPRCGSETSELILLGARDYIDRCCECGVLLIGGGPCPRHPERRTERVRDIEEHERLSSTEPCDKCREEMKQHETIVAAGGIYFRCAACHQSGVIRETAELARFVREQMGVDPPKPCGIEFQTCTEHEVTSK